MTTLWDTTGTAVVAALGAARHEAGGVASGLVLTLVVVADEERVGEVENAAKTASSAHPCRVLVVVRGQLDAPVPRLDAEVSIGGRLGPGESVVLRMNGRLALHAESVVLPLLASDAPVVTWWVGTPPDLIAHDPLGVLADRRVTDVAHCPDPVAGLVVRAHDYAPGDTDLAWSRATPWRAVLAGAFDAVVGTPTSASVTARPESTSSALLAAWLGDRLNIDVPRHDGTGTGIRAAEVLLDGGEDAGGTTIRLVREGDRTGTLTRTGEPDRIMPLPWSDLGDLLAEELRRLDDDVVYAGALGRLAGVSGLNDRPRVRTHIWRDPAQQAAAE
ncbi:MAG TPA: glucose-6-phosphate dehydrogenase assembly protein OpcA [Mycobacteriales bacterium]